MNKAGQRIVPLRGRFWGVSSAKLAAAVLGREGSVTLIGRSRRTYLCGSFPLLI